MTIEHNNQRRRFLLSTSAAALAVGAGGAVLPGCGNGMMMMMTTTPVDSGLTVADVAVGVVKLSTDTMFFVGHDAGGFYAFTSTCTHEACIVPAPTTGATTSPSVGITTGTSTCPCHMSQYNGNGDVMTGPAIRSLDHWTVTFTGTGATARILVAGVVVADRTARVTAP